MSLLGGFLKPPENKAKGTKGQLAGRNSSGGAIVAPPENTAPTHAELFPELSRNERKKLSAVSQSLATIAVESPAEFALIRDGVKTVTAVLREMKPCRHGPAGWVPGRCQEEWGIR